MEEHMPRRNNLLPASILLAAVLVSGSIFYAVGRNGSAPKEKVSVNRDQLAALAALPVSNAGGRDVIVGDPKAPVTIIEYGDFQCPFCGRFFSQTEPMIREQFVKTGKVNMIYRHFAFLGPESFAAAEASECAKDQKKFWGFHDALYQIEGKDGREHNGNLNRDLFLAIADELKLDAKDFASCVDGGAYAEAVRKESDEGRAKGVDSTPSFFVNGTLVRGAIPFEDYLGQGGDTQPGFKSIIDNALKAQ
ncbi:MAG: DsbA family protein [Patescibacteria group bacterium]